MREPSGIRLRVRRLEELTGVSALSVGLPYLLLQQGKQSFLVLFRNDSMFSVRQSSVVFQVLFIKQEYANGLSSCFLGARVNFPKASTCYLFPNVVVSGDLVAHERERERSLE